MNRKLQILHFTFKSNKEYSLNLDNIEWDKKCNVKFWWYVKSLTVSHIPVLSVLPPPRRRLIVSPFDLLPKSASWFGGKILLYPDIRSARYRVYWNDKWIWSLFWIFFNYFYSINYIAINTLHTTEKIRFYPLISMRWYYMIPFV